MTPSSRTNSLTGAVPVVVPMNQLPSNIVHSHNNGSSTSLRNTVYTNQPFNPYNQMHSHPKLQPTNIVKASSSENNSSLSSLPETTASPSTSLTNTSNESRTEVLKLNVPLTLKTDQTRYSANSSNKSSAYSSSSSSSIEDHPNVDSNTYLTQSISDTPQTSINTNEREKFHIASSTSPTNQTIQEHPVQDESDDVKHIVEHFDKKEEESDDHSLHENLEHEKETFEDAEDTQKVHLQEVEVIVAGKEFEEEAHGEKDPELLQDADVINVPEENTSEFEIVQHTDNYIDDTNLSTLNEVSEENLIAKSVTNTSIVSPNPVSFSLPVTEAPNESEESLFYATPRQSPSKEKNRISFLPHPTIALQPPSVAVPHEEQPKHYRDSTALPDPNIDLSETERATPKANPDLAEYSLLYQSSPLNSGCNTPRSSKFFDFNSDKDVFNKFLNDTQEAVPPRGDLVVVKKNKIRKHERSASSISSFNSIINGDTEPPRTPVRSQSPEGEAFSKSLPALKLKDACMKSLPPSPKDVTVAIEELKPPVAIKEIVPPGSLNGSLNLYSINEASKTSLQSQKDTKKEIKEVTLKPKAFTIRELTPKQKASMLDVLDDPPTPVSKSSPQKAAARPRPQPKDVNVTLSRRAGSVPNFPSPSKTLRSQDFSRSMSSLGSSSKPVPKRSTSVNNFKSFFRKVFNKSSSNINTSAMETDDDKLSFNTSNILESKSIQSVSFHSINTSSASSRAESRSIASNSVSPAKVKKSFSLANVSLRSTFMKKQEKPKEKEPKLETIKSAHSDTDHTDQTLTMVELPSFETDTHMFDDMFVSINNVSEQAERFVTSSIPPAPRLTTKDPFLKDDELTSAQIHDQQIKDKQEDKQELESRRNSDETYIDDNIRFLQSEFQWTKLEDEEFEDDVEPTKETYAQELTQTDDVDTIVMSQDQLNLIFNNLSDFQRRHLPGHLKYIKQFKDFKYIEVSVKKFEDLSGIDLSTHLPESPSILKKAENDNKNKKRVMFSNKIHVNETFPPDMYKRYNKSVTQYTLTESYEINRIKSELNSFKCNEMLVHENSQNNTHFFY